MAMRRLKSKSALSRNRFHVGRNVHSGSILWTVLVVLFVMAALIGTIWYFLRTPANSSADAPIVQAAARGPFDHIVLEQGEVESSSNVDVICEIKSRSMGSGGVAILWVIDEGTRVKKGDKLVELDSSVLEQDTKQQRNIVNSSLASKISAEALLQQATIARQEYLDGTFTTEERALLSEIAVAEQDLRKAQLKLQSAERLAAKGLVTSLQLEADQFAVENSKNLLESAQGRLKVLRELTKKKMLVQFDSDIEAAKATVESQTKIYEEEIDKLEDLEDQITKCVILAPDDGVVVHSNKYSSRGGSAEFVVEAGAIVRERQTIIRLPDPSKMQVRAKINESQIALVKEGMPVKIKIGASEGTELDGRVTKVNKYAEPSSFFSSQVKDFATFIAILDPPPTIRTGMTAEARILVDHQDDAIQIPVQAVHEHRGHTFCLVKQGETYETREIQIGASNDKAVTVESGVSEGEQVVLSPRRHLDLMDLPDLPVLEGPNAVAFKAFKESANDDTSDSAATRTNAGAGNVKPAANAEGPPVGGSRSPESIAAGILSNIDTNQDGKLSAEELQQMPEDRRSGMLEADTNGDGFVDLAEMTARMRQRMASGGDGPGGGQFGGGAQ